MSEKQSDKSDGDCQKVNYAVGAFVGGVITTLFFICGGGLFYEASKCNEKSKELSKQVERFDDRVESLHRFYMKERDEYQNRLKRLENVVNEALKDDGN